jgi:hypothetical protein
VQYNEYDVDEENDGHDPDIEYDCEYNAMSMCAIFVPLAKLSVCEKLQEVVPYHEYDVDEENDGHDPGSEYDCQ